MQARPVNVVQRLVVPETSGNGAARPKADAAGIGTRVPPPGLWEANPRLDRPSAPAANGRDEPKRDKPQPKIDINGIVTTVQRRLMHHTAIERERRGMAR